MPQNAYINPFLPAGDTFGFVGSAHLPACSNDTNDQERETKEVDTEAAWKKAEAERK